MMNATGSNAFGHASRFALHSTWGASLIGIVLAAAVASCNGCSSTPEPESPPVANVTSPAQGSSAPADPGQPGADAGECVKGGCASELCQEPGAQQPAFTTCDYKKEYDCYKTATCGRDEQGQCNWQMTPELEKCLKVSR